jgi:hypothetical protein
MTTLKTLLNFGFAGAIFGFIGATLVGPPSITWYSTPGTGQAMCDCANLVRDTTTRLIQIQLYGIAIGATAFLIIGVLVVRARSNKLPPTVLPPDITG